MSNIILGAAIGGLAALVVSAPAIIFETFKHGKVKNLPLIVEVKTWFDFRLSQLASFALGILLHVLMGMFFGAVYPAVADQGWLNWFGSVYEPVSFLVYTLIIWLVFGVFLFPIFGFGFFGHREGKLVWLEVLVSLLLIAVLFELVTPLFQPVFF